jgi:tRNA 2-thiouridine synthesizing protein D
VAKTITILFMDGPYESANSTTALRIIDAALRKGINVNVLAYEGAVSYSFTQQKPPMNPIKSTRVEEEQHPTTKDWVAALGKLAESSGVKLDWMRCGMCEDERGVHQNQTAGTRRGSPVDFYQQHVETSDNILIIPTR